MNWGRPLECANRSSWRAWLYGNHARATEVFLLIFRDRSQLPGLRYDEAVREALCFGWVDGIARRFDSERSLNRFTPRRAGSNWSDSNRARIGELYSVGLIEAAGWDVIPADLQNELRGLN